MTQAGNKNFGRLALAAALATLLTSPASADYPGAMWSVDQIQITGATDAQAQAIRTGLGKANNTYFYGDHPVAMSVKVTGADAMVVTLTDIASGKVLSRTAPIALDADLTGEALAWMDKLECTSADCLGGGTETALAAVHIPELPASGTPERAQIVAAAKVPNLSGTVSTAIAKGMPMPKPRPGTGLAALDLTGLEQIRIAKTPDPKLLEGAEPIRVARFNAANLGNISYAASDRLVLAQPRTAAVAPVAPRLSATERTLFGRLFFGLARFLGISGSSQPDTQLAAAPAQQAPATTSARALAPTTTTPTQPFQPSERWRLTPQTTAPAVAPAAEQRVAALGNTTISTPSASQPLQPAQQPQQAVPEFTGLRLVPSPGLRPPAPRDDQSGPVVTPIRVASLRATPNQGGQGNGDLSVRLSPELFTKYTPQAFKHLFGSYGNQNAKVALVADEPGSGGSVDRVLASRGLELDSGRYAKAERVYWGGQTGSCGFWISMPRVPPSAFVLIASNKASVIANVHTSGNGVRVSDAVADALGMRAGTWSDVQVVALRQLDRTARRDRPRSALQ